MSGNHTYVVHTNDIYGDPVFATRHEAVGEKAILEAVVPEKNPQIRVRKRYATDPV